MAYKPVFFKLQCASESPGGLVRAQIGPTPIFPVDAGDEGAYFESCQQPALSDTPGYTAVQYTEGMSWLNTDWLIHKVAAIDFQRQPQCG